jgi:hypothetical protein
MQLLLSHQFVCVASLENWRTIRYMLSTCLVEIRSLGKGKPFVHHEASSCLVCGLLQRARHYAVGFVDHQQDRYRGR